MLLTIAEIIRSIADACGAVVSFFGTILIGIVFVLYFVAFAIAEGLGMGKID